MTYITAFAIANSAPVRVDLWPMSFLLETSIGVAVLLSIGLGFLMGVAYYSTTLIRLHPDRLKNGSTSDEKFEGGKELKRISKNDKVNNKTKKS